MGYNHEMQYWSSCQHLSPPILQDNDNIFKGMLLLGTLLVWTIILPFFSQPHTLFHRVFYVQHS